MADSRVKLSLNFLNQFFLNVHVFLWSYLNPRPGEGSAQVGRAAGGGAPAKPRRSSTPCQLTRIQARSVHGWYHRARQARLRRHGQSTSHWGCLLPRTLTPAACPCPPIP